jgi:hypothetical protein
LRRSFFPDVEGAPAADDPPVHSIRIRHSSRRSPAKGFLKGLQMTVADWSITKQKVKGAEEEIKKALDGLFKKK